MKDKVMRLIGKIRNYNCSMKADDKDVLWIQMGRVQLALIVAQVAFNIIIIANMRCRYNCSTNYFSHCKYVSYIPMV